MCIRDSLYQDQVNEGVLMRPGIHLTRALVFLDQRGVDGAAGGLAALIGGTSSRLRTVSYTHLQPAEAVRGDPVSLSLTTVAGMSAGMPLVGDAAAAHAASGFAAYAWLLVAFPLLGAAVLLLGGRRTDSWGPLFATAMSWAAFLVGFGVFLRLLRLGSEARALSLPLFPWVPAGQFQPEAGMLLDPLSVAFVLFVTFVGSLIHV